MGKHRISAAASSEIPIEQIWSRLTDVPSWTDWGPYDEAEIERIGNDDPSGVGMIRQLKNGRITVREEIVEIDPPHRMSYILLSGLPLRNYRAEVTLEKTADGTDITWTSTFDCTLGTGWIYKWMLRTFLRRDLLPQLADHT